MAALELRARSRQATLRFVIALQGALIAHFPCQLGGCRAVQSSI